MLFRSYAEVKPVVIDTGKYLFQSRCEGCHSLGKGERIGPDLAGLSTRRERGWIARYVNEPEKVRGAGDVAALDLMKRYKMRMPAQNLGQDDLAALLKYLDSQGAAQAPGAAKLSALAR